MAKGEYPGKAEATGGPDVSRLLKKARNLLRGLQPGRRVRGQDAHHTRGAAAALQFRQHQAAGGQVPMGLPFSAPGQVIGVVEVIRDILRIRTLKVIESGILDEGQCERLGRALLGLETALEDVKKEPGVAGQACAVKCGTDYEVEYIVSQILNPSEGPKFHKNEIHTG